MAKNQWDYEQASPANRWMLKHVFMAPGGFYRFIGVAFLGIAVLLAGVALWEHASPAGPAEPGFFPFMACVFAGIGILLLLVWLVIRVRSRGRGG